MYGVEKRFKMQLFLGLKGSPLVGAGILNFVTPERGRDAGGQDPRRAPRASGAPYVADQVICEPV